MIVGDVVDTTVWYSAEYAVKGTDDWCSFDSSIDSDTLDTLKMRLEGRIQAWAEWKPDVCEAYQFRMIRKELTTVVVEVA